MSDSPDWLGKLKHIGSDSPLVKEGLSRMQGTMNTFTARFSPISSEVNRITATKLWKEQVIPIFARAIHEINYLDIVKNRGLANPLRHQALSAADDKLRQAEAECRNMNTQSRLAALVGPEDEIRRLRIELWGFLLAWDKAELSSD
ncbi:MAG: hypothetical protein G01um10148_785 [Parcubacteria group bacterium Gr01-1014_8]|nr:MAG: hypothetical protein G01um10148_785 [Parcubacteria group bacterium Gr01-1014_8]